MLHIHEWERIGDFRHSHYDYSGFEVLTAICKCKICGKEKERKFCGHLVGQLFDERFEVIQCQKPTP